MDWILQKSIKRFLRFMTFLIITIILWINSCARGELNSGQSELTDSPYKPDLKPNIIIIMADDMGYSDLGCYGGEINTPNLDNLAYSGLRFTQFYNAARCCPTRASLLTGLYPHQAGVGRMTQDQGEPGYQGKLSKNAVTIAEVLKETGYHTGMVGKWHVSITPTHPEDHLKWVSHLIDRDRQFSDTNTYPVNRGFDEFYGIIWGVVDYFDPFSLVMNTTPIDSVPDDYYITDAISDYAVKFIDQFNSDDKPFFLYVAYTAPHWPLHALPEDIQKYEGTYKVGWEKIRDARYRRMVDMGLIKESGRYRGKLSPRDSTLHEIMENWDENETKEWDAQAMAVHAAMIDRLDQGIGRIIEKLRESGELNNTLIFFLSDNGASSEIPSKYGPGFDRPSHTREGEKVHFPVDKEYLPGPENVWSGIGPLWANVCNTPFRYWKAKEYEGGTCTPLIVFWPEGITVKSGSITRQSGHIIDLMATCIDVARAEYPLIYKGNRIKPLEGKSLLPIFSGREREGHESIFLEHFTSAALRKGDWKLVTLGRGDRSRSKVSTWRLYNLAEDRTELNDLSKENPEKFEELRSLWERLAWYYNAFPLP